MKAILKIGLKSKVCELSQDPQSKDTNRFVARKWVSTHVDDGSEITVTFADGSQVLDELTLRRTVNSAGRTVFTNKNDTGGIYVWATLTAGYGTTWGFTAGILARRKKRFSLQDETQKPKDVQESLW